MVETRKVEEGHEEFAQKLSEKVRYFCGKGQYERGSQEQQAYIDGVETAIGMMYIDLTGTPKSEGMLQNLLDQHTARLVERIEVTLRKELHSLNLDEWTNDIMLSIKRNL